MTTTPIGSPTHQASVEPEMPTPQRKDKGKAPAISSSVHVFTDIASESESGLSDDPAPFAGRELTNKPNSPNEKFAPHDTDPSKIEATFKIKMPDGSGWFTQTDIIPEQRDPADEELYEKKSDVVVRWNKVAAFRWERNFKGNHEVFTPSIALRRFNARTHAYEVSFDYTRYILEHELTAHSRNYSTFTSAFQSSKTSIPTTRSGKMRTTSGSTRSRGAQTQTTKRRRRGITGRPARSAPCTQPSTPLSTTTASMHTIP
jgi:hypothetical protein